MILTNLTIEFKAMCCEANEVQTSWIPSKGDICLYEGHRGDITGLIVNFIPHHSEDKSKDKILIYDGSASQTTKDYIYKNAKELDRLACVWLPSQNQLQQIFAEDLHSGKISSRIFITQTIDKIIKTGKSEDHAYFDLAQSWEELWLMMVMQEKFKRRWDSRKGVWIAYENIKQI